MSEKIRKIVVMAMLVAVSIVLVYLIHFPIFPSAAFLEYDPADIPILIGAFAYGPVAGLLITVVAAVIQGLTVSAGSGLYGVIMHIIATGVLVLVAGTIYKLIHTRVGAIIGLVIGTVCMGLGDGGKPLYYPGIHGCPHRGGGRHAPAGDPALQPHQGRGQLPDHLPHLQDHLPLHHPRRGLEEEGEVFRTGGYHQRVI